MNASFEHMSILLQDQNVKNHDFFLALKDKSLEGVNPFDLTLPYSMKRCIIEECRTNIWYFLRECVYTIDNLQARPFQLNVANLASITCFMNGIDHYIAHPFMAYDPESYLAILAWVFLFTPSSSSIFSSFSPSSQLLLRRLVELINRLPRYLKSEVCETSSSLTAPYSTGDKVIEHRVTARQSSHFSDTSIDSGLVQRTFEPVILYVDVENMVNAGNVVTITGNDYAFASDRAKRNGNPHGRIFVSTVGESGVESTEDMYRFIQTMTPWKDSFYDDLLDEEKRMSLYARPIYIEEDYFTLGKDMEWFENQCRALLHNAERIDRLLLMERV